MKELFAICILVRLLFVYVAYRLSTTLLPYMGIVALFPAIGFLIVYNRRMTGFEAGGKIWWNDLRPVHSLIYFLFAYLAITKQTSIAWKVLLLDVILGASAFTYHHFL